jgi:hypothetical protein
MVQYRFKAMPVTGPYCRRSVAVRWVLLAGRCSLREGNRAMTEGKIGTADHHVDVGISDLLLTTAAPAGGDPPASALPKADAEARRRF